MQTMNCALKIPLTKEIDAEGGTFLKAIGQQSLQPCTKTLPSNSLKATKELYLENHSSLCIIWNIFLCSGVVELWEAILTLVFFFAVVIMAYVADKKFFYKRLKKRSAAYSATVYNKINQTCWP